MSAWLDHGTVPGRIAAAFGANVVGRGLATVTQIIGPVLFLGCWSVDLYGEWLMLTALPSAFAASDLGFCSAAANEMALRSARGDLEGARRLFQHGLGLILAVSGLLILLVLALVLSVDLAVRLGLVGITAAEARSVLIILTLQVALGLPGELLHGGFRSCNRFAEGLMISNIMILADPLLCLIALVGFGTPVAVAVAALIAQALRQAAGFALMRHRLGWPGLLRPRFSWAEYRRLLPPAIGFASAMLARVGMTQGMVILVGLFTDPRVVVVFTTTRTAVRLVSTMAGLVAIAITAELSLAWAAACDGARTGVHDGRALLQTLLFGGGQVALWSGLAAALALLAGRHLLARLWLHNAVDFGLELMVPMIAAELAASVSRVCFTVVAAANRHARIGLISCLLTLGGLGLAALLVPWLGIPGAGLAVMVAEAAALALTIHLASHLAGTRSPIFVARILVPPWRLLHLP